MGRLNLPYQHWGVQALWSTAQGDDGAAPEADRNGKEKNPGWSRLMGGKLQVRQCSLGTDEPNIALRPGLRHGIVTENNGVRGVEIRNATGGTAVVANNEPERKGP